MLIMLEKERRFLKKIQLKNRQRVLNKQYEREGLSDEVLEAQVELNQLRNELDIPDSDNFIHEKFVQ